MSFLSKKKTILLVAALLFGFCVLYDHLYLHRFLQSYSFIKSKTEIMNLSRSIDSIDAILRVDNQTHFLDSETRNFLKTASFYVFPSKYKQIFLDTLLEFDRVWRQKLKRPYMFLGGTLIGTFRHGGVVPWDDDLDIMVDMKYHDNIGKDFAGTKFNITKLGQYGNFRKLFLTHKSLTTAKGIHWPFIDFFFYKTVKNGAAIKLQGIFKDEYPSKFVFPIIRMPHDGHTFFTPKCPKEMLGISHECCTHRYNHRLDKTSKRSCIACSKLFGLFRFVKWERLNKTHSQKMILEPHPLQEMARMHRSGKLIWNKGPVVFMPQC